MGEPKMKATILMAGIVLAMTQPVQAQDARWELWVNRTGQMTYATSHTTEAACKAVAQTYVSSGAAIEAACGYRAASSWAGWYQNPADGQWYVVGTFKSYDQCQSDRMLVARRFVRDGFQVGQTSCQPQ